MPTAPSPSWTSSSIRSAAAGQAGSPAWVPKRSPESSASAAALAPNCSRRRAEQVIEHLARGQRVDRGVEQRPQPREQLLRVTALRAGPGSPLHGAEAYPPCRRARTISATCVRTGGVVESRAMRLPLLIAAAVLALPATAAAAPPPNDNYLASSHDQPSAGVPRQRRHGRGDDPARPLQPEQGRPAVRRRRPGADDLRRRRPASARRSGGTSSRRAAGGVADPRQRRLRRRRRRLHVERSDARASPARCGVRTMKRARRMCLIPTCQRGNQLHDPGGRRRAARAAR